MAARKKVPEYVQTPAQKAEAEKIARELARYHADAGVANSIKYQGWIAVYNKEVVARAPDMDSILDAARDLELDLRYVFFRNCKEREELDNI